MAELTTPGSNLDAFLYAFWPLIQRVVLSRTTALPGSPTDGDTYIVVDTDPTHPNEIAVRKNGAWAYQVPTEGWMAYVVDDDEFVQFDGTNWTSFPETASTTDVLTGTNAAKTVTADSLAALWEKGSDVASAGTVSLGEGGFFHVTGTTTITDIDFATAKDGRTAYVVFDGALTLTHNGTTLKLPGNANITTAAGDRAIFVQDSSDNVICILYQRASGTPIGAVSASQTFMLTGLIEAPADGDYRIAANIPFAMTITKVTTRSASGTCTLTAKINTTALGGTANSVSTSEDVQTHASSNAASAGDDIVLTVSSNASATKVTVTIEYTRTLP